MITVNGKEKADLVGKSIATLLKSHKLSIGNLAVELNGKIVPHSEFGSILLRENDKVEIISFVGGG